MKFPAPIDLELKFQKFRILPERWAKMDVEFDASVVTKREVTFGGTVGFVHADACLFACHSSDLNCLQEVVCCNKSAHALIFIVERDDHGRFHI